MIKLLFIVWCVLSTYYIATMHRVWDGDTYDVREIDGTTIRVRLRGVDCPENGQPYGKNAREFVKNLTANKSVSVKLYTQDKYGRYISDVYVGETSIADTLLISGLAWHYKKYDTGCYLDSVRRDSLENVAKFYKRGLWAQEKPISPELYRKNRWNK